MRHAPDYAINKWSEHEGYYSNKFNSHLIGKLGEVAVEKHILKIEYKLDSYFRFPDREKQSDIVVKIRKYTQVCRLEIKIWSANYWEELGRCVSVDQYPD